MRMGDGEGLGDPDVKSTLLKLAHPSRDTGGTGRKRAGPLLLCHLQVVADRQNSEGQVIILITFSLEKPPHLGKIGAQIGRNFLGIQPLGHLDSKIRLACLGLLTRFIALSGRLLDHCGILVRLLLQCYGPLLSL